MVPTKAAKGFLTMYEEEDQNGETLDGYLDLDEFRITSIRLVSYISLNLDLLNLQNSYSHTDVRIDCKDGFIRVHHCILAAASPNIDRLYDRNNSNGKSKEENNGYSLDDRNHRKINAIQLFSVKDIASVLFLFYLGETAPCFSLSKREAIREVLRFFKINLADTEIMIDLTVLEKEKEEKGKKDKQKREKFDKYFIRFNTNNYINGLRAENFISGTGTTQAAASEVVVIQGNEETSSSMNCYIDNNLIFFPFNGKDCEPHRCPRCRTMLVDVKEFISHVTGCYRNELFEQSTNPRRNVEDSGLQMIDPGSRSGPERNSTQTESSTCSSMGQNSMRKHSTIIFKCIMLSPEELRRITNYISQKKGRTSSTGSTEENRGIRKSDSTTASAGTGMALIIANGTSHGGASKKTVRSTGELENDRPNLSVVDLNVPTESLNDHLECAAGMRVCDICKYLAENFEAAIAHLKKAHEKQIGDVLTDLSRISQIFPPYDPEKDNSFTCKLKDCGKAFVTNTGFMEHYKVDHKMRHRTHYEAVPFPSCRFCNLRSHRAMFDADMTAFFYHVYECFQTKKATMLKGWRPYPKGCQNYSAPDHNSPKWYKRIDFRPTVGTTLKDNQTNSMLAPSHGMKLRSRSRSVSCIEEVPVPPVVKSGKGVPKKVPRQGAAFKPVRKTSAKNYHLGQNSRAVVTNVSQGYISRRDQCLEDQPKPVDTAGNIQILNAKRNDKRVQSREASVPRTIKRPKYSSTPLSQSKKRPSARDGGQPHKELQNSDLNDSPIPGPKHQAVNTQIRISYDSDSESCSDFSDDMVEDESSTDSTIFPDVSPVSRVNSNGRKCRMKGKPNSRKRILAVSPDSSGSVLHLARRLSH